MLGFQSICSKRQNYSRKSGIFAAICHCACFFSLIFAPIIFANASGAAANTANVTDANKAKTWICGPAFDPASTRNANFLPLTSPLDPPEMVDGLVFSNTPKTLWRLADIAFVPGFEDDALVAMRRMAGTAFEQAVYSDDVDFAGRKLMDLRDDARLLWQEVLLERGLAILLPEGKRSVDVFANAEERAIVKRLGIWGDDVAAPYHYGGSPDRAGILPDANLAVGHFAVIDAVLQRIEDREWRSYLNFGENWRSDFTVMVGRDLRDEIVANGQHMENWIGQTIRIRGVIEDRGGPYIELAELAALCLARP